MAENVDNQEFYTFVTYRYVLFLFLSIPPEKGGNYSVRRGYVFHYIVIGWLASVRIFPCRGHGTLYRYKCATILPGTCKPLY